MKCQNCGADIPQGKIYCESCGTAIQMVPDYNPEEDITIGSTGKKNTETIHMEEPASGQRESRWYRWRYRMAGICLVLFGMLAYQIAYRQVLIPRETETEAEMPVLLSKPEFGVQPGKYEYSLEVTIAHEQREEGIIYYTTDGTTPGENSMVYKRPIIVDEGTTVIRAVFIRSDGMQSEEADGTYEVVFDYPDEPIFSMLSGTYDRGFYVTLTAEPNCKIYYTTNGEEPGYTSRVYREPLYIPAGLTVLQAVAVDEDGGMSGIVEAIYNVKGSVPEETEETEEIPPATEVNP